MEKRNFLDFRKITWVDMDDVKILKIKSAENKREKTRPCQHFYLLGAFWEGHHLSTRPLFLCISLAFLCVFVFPRVKELWLVSEKIHTLSQHKETDKRKRRKEKKKSIVCLYFRHQPSYKT